MLKPLVRVLSFFAKELAEIRRQPRLLLSLVLGPFLILLLFGLGFQGEQPRLNLILVVPPNLQNDPRVAQLQQVINAANFTVVDITTDEQAAIDRMLASNGAIDVVEILPPDLNTLLGRQQPAQLRLLYNEINPTQEQWIQYLAYVQVKELNTALLVSAVSGSSQQVSNLQQFIDTTQADLERVDQGLGAAQSDEARTTIQRLRGNSGLILAGLALSSTSDANQTAQDDVQEIQRSLDELEQALDDGAVGEQRQRIAEINERLDRVRTVADQVSTTPPEVLVSPLQSTPQNLAQQQINFISYYAPGVLALLLQHLTVTLAALSLVRENLLGTTEIFRVAPVGTFQIMLGKYAGFILFTAIVAAALVGLLISNIPIGSTGYAFGLGVPFVGSAPWFVLAMLLLTIASLGLGFLISALSKSESQAVQLSMISLLASVFFSGFFLPLENFAPFARWLAYILPVTHGVTAFQAIMLRGQLPPVTTFMWLAGISLVCFVLSVSIWRSNLKRR